MVRLESSINTYHEIIGSFSKKRMENTQLYMVLTNVYIHRLSCYLYVFVNMCIR